MLLFIEILTGLLNLFVIQDFDTLWDHNVEISGTIDKFDLSQIKSLWPNYMISHLNVHADMVNPKCSGFCRLLVISQFCSWLLEVPIYDLHRMLIASSTAASRD